MAQTPSQSAAAEILALLRRLKLLSDNVTPNAVPLAGGVSSDIWRVDLPSGPVCIKRALSRLKVAQVWEAPIERNQFEWEWMRIAAELCPGSVPEPLAQDKQLGVLVMRFLPPDEYPIWKAQLRDGHADPATAENVGRILAKIHAGTAGKQEIAARFPSDEIFYAIRLEPYLVATGRIHADLAGRFAELVQRTAATKRALVHGDVSPKNILIGAAGPVFLDAECAWYGDPAFDLAFCLNHLLLKCLWTPAARAGFLACFDALAQNYLAGVTWESPDAIERRTAELLPGLFLARVDGKSPVEYLTAEADKNRVRRVARRLLIEPVGALSAVRAAWAGELGVKELGA
ncbi:MAG: phosphotransferase [Alphaproteobacteria bacterium]